VAKKRRFQSGSDDLEQLESIEAEQQRSRKVRRRQRTEPTPTHQEPLIERIDKSKKRVKNRFARIKDFEDAIREFGS
jgi:polynucleotide 5'-kinase involved in rRNA processing